MKTLRLEIDTLTVDSSTATPDGRPLRRTVMGQDSDGTTCLSCEETYHGCAAQMGFLHEQGCTNCNEVC